MSTIQLPAELEQKIKEDAEKKHPFIWPKNKQGEEIGMRVGQKGAPGSAKARKIQRIYIDAVTPYAAQLVEAQERIKFMEDKLYYIRESYSDAQNSIAFTTANEALLPNKVKEKEDE